MYRCYSEPSERPSWYQSRDVGSLTRPTDTQDGTPTTSSSATSSSCASTTADVPPRVVVDIPLSSTHAQSCFSAAQQAPSSGPLPNSITLSHTPTRPPSPFSKPPKGDTDSWAHFPSHTRASRVEAPRAADGVTIRDFALEMPVEISRSKKKKSQGTNFTGKIWNAYSRFCKLLCCNCTGPRSRSQPSPPPKPLKHPELERIPRDRLFHPREDPEAALTNWYGLYTIGDVADLQSNKSEGSLIPPEETSFKRQSVV